MNKSLCAGLMAGILSTVACVASAADSALILGKSSYNANCAICHGEDGTGTGDVADLLRVAPPDLTTLSERSNGAFPFSEVYSSISDGKFRAHGGVMPIWGDDFMTDTLTDRGMNADDAAHIVQGRILSLVYYLESIQK